MLSALPGFFLFWVRFCVKAVDPPQKLRHNKTKKGLAPTGKSRRKNLALCRAWNNPSGGWRSRGRFTHPWWGKQSTWLAASGCLARLRAWPAPTFDQRRPADSGTRRAGRRKPPSWACGPCVPVSGRRWGQRPCRGYLDSVGPCVRWGCPGQL